MDGKYWKYPRTFHAPWSRPHKDDKKHFSMDNFHGREVVVTEKMDGENTTMYNDHYHARSLDSANHPSRNAVKAIWGQIRYMIPENLRLCGENVYAEHSIFYEDLESFFLGFSVWNNDTNVKLSYDDGLAKMREWGVTPVRELWRGVYDEAVIKALWDETARSRTEGYVIQVVDEIPFEDFTKLVAKYVRKGHVQTDEHWRNKPIAANRLK